MEMCVYVNSRTRVIWIASASPRNDKPQQLRGGAEAIHLLQGLQHSFGAFADARDNSEVHTG